MGRGTSFGDGEEDGDSMMMLVGCTHFYGFYINCAYVMYGWHVWMMCMGIQMLSITFLP